MNKKFFSFLMLGMALCASCSSDDEKGGKDSGAPGEQSGTLVGDDAEDNAAVANLRITSVGSYRYTYDSNGKLQTISDNDTYDGWTASAKDNFKIQSEWKDGSEKENSTYTFTIVNNHITAISGKSTYEYEDEKETSSGVAYFKYNGKGQLSSIEYSSTWTEIDEGRKYSGSESGTVILKYSSDNRLLSVEVSDVEKEGGEKWTYNETITYDYSSSRPNVFYQYTPRIWDDYYMDDDFDAFAYVGLFGKATSYIPARSTVEYTEKDDEEEYSDSYTQTYNCSFNSNGTISYADYYSYGYTSLDTRALVANDEPVTIAKEQSDRKPRHGFMSGLLRERAKARRSMK